MAGNNSLSGIISTLIPVLLVAVAMFIAFLILRRTLTRQYAPRTFMLREQERSPALSSGMFGWIKEFMAIPDSWVLNHQSIDGFLLLRYLRIITIICFVGCLITWPILFPVNATGGGGQQQLDILSLTNISTVQTPNNRLYAHVFVSWVFFGFVWYMIARETIYYINLRQAYLLSPLYANRMSSRTVLYASVPDEFLDSGKIRRLFGPQLKNFWISTDCKELQKLVDERDKVAFKLEGAENKLVKLANDARLKAIKKGEASHDDNDADAAVDGSAESGSAASRWVPAKDRPTHKTKFLIGKKVDTINWCRAELERLIPEVRAMQAKHKAGDVKYVNSIIVEFYTQADAQAACQTTTHHQALHMSPRYTSVNPEGIIWKNMAIKWWERILRNAGTITLVCLTIIFWAIPVAFVGFLSNIDGLINGTPGHPPIAPWLSFLNKIPPVIFGVVKGLLPSVLLSVLMALLPVFLRIMSKMGGCMTDAQVELRTQNFYFAFQIIQVFLVVTLGSTATAVIQEISASPSSTPKILASSLPKAANFYISYFIVQGLTFASGALLSIVGLILFKVLGKLLDKTPRKMYKRWMSLSGLGWATVFPVYSLLACIAIIYSCIAPLVLGFATLGLWLFYFAFRYNLLFVYNVNVDTNGLVYPRALQHLTVGLYIGEVLMLGLFAVAEAPGPTILMLIALIASILFHVSLNSAVDPLLKTLPKSLAVEEEDLLALESGHGTRNGDTVAATASEDDGAKGALSLPAPHKKPNLLVKWLRPDIYCDYQTLRRMVPRDFADTTYTEEIEKNAFYNPCIASEPPVIWIPRDVMGVSREEVAHTSKVIPISDEGAHFDDKGKVAWDMDSQPPVYQEKIYY